MAFHHDLARCRHTGQQGLARRAVHAHITARHRGRRIDVVERSHAHIARRGGGAAGVDRPGQRRHRHVLGGCDRPGLHVARLAAQRHAGARGLQRAHVHTRVAFHHDLARCRHAGQQGLARRAVHVHITARHRGGDLDVVQRRQAQVFFTRDRSQRNGTARGRHLHVLIRPLVAQTGARHRAARDAAAGRQGHRIASHHRVNSYVAIGSHRHAAPRRRCVQIAHPHIQRIAVRAHTQQTGDGELGCGIDVGDHVQTRVTAVQHPARCADNADGSRRAVTGLDAGDAGVASGLDIDRAHITAQLGCITHHLAWSKGFPIIQLPLGVLHVQRRSAQRDTSRRRVHITFGGDGRGAARDEVEVTRARHGAVNTHGQVGCETNAGARVNVANIEAPAQRTVEEYPRASGRLCGDATGVGLARGLVSHQLDTHIQSIPRCTHRPALSDEVDIVGQHIEQLVWIRIEDRTRRSQLDIIAREHRIDQQIAALHHVHIAGSARREGCPRTQTDVQWQQNFGVDTVGRDVPDTAIRSLQNQVARVHCRYRRIDDRSAHLDSGLVRRADRAQSRITLRCQVNPAIVGLRGQRSIDRGIDRGIRIEPDWLALRHPNLVVGDHHVRTLCGRQRHLLLGGQVLGQDAGRDHHLRCCLADRTAGHQGHVAAADVGALDHRVGAGQVLEQARGD